MVLAMPPELQDSEKAFLLGKSPGTRDMWLSLPTSLRTKAAETRRRAELIRARTPGAGEEQEQGAGAQEGEQVGEEQTSGITQQDPLPHDLPTFEEAHRTHIPTLIHPPKAARGEFTRHLTEIWRRINMSPEDPKAWLLEYIYTRVILPAGRGPRKGDAYSQARMVKERLKQWGRGEYRMLWDEAVKMTAVPPRARRKRTGEPEQATKSQEEKNGERATKLAQEGQYSRALQSLTSQGMADAAGSTVKAMEEKHPQPTHQKAPQPSTTAPQLSFSQADVFKAAMSFRRGSAPGPSGLRPEHLKVAVKSPSPNRAEKKKRENRG